MNRSGFGLAFALATLVASLPVTAAEPVFSGRDVNVVGPPYPASDAFPDIGLRQQNEPYCAVDPEIASRICCGFNDYRGVDIEGLGEAWEGIACSIDGGASWTSQLIPGHRLDPDYSLDMEFAADPNLVAVPGGLIFNYIAADRDKLRGGLYVQRFLWRNKETGWPLERVGGPIAITDHTMPGGIGRFTDKPHATAFLDEDSDAVVRWAGTERDLPAGTLLVAAAGFAPETIVQDQIARLLVWRSEDWGQTWTFTELGTGRDLPQSGLNLVANGNPVCAVWRRFAREFTSDAIFSQCSDDGGASFEPEQIVAEICPFDQTTLAGDPPLEHVVSFRSNAFPVISADGTRFYTFWTDRGFAAASGGAAGCELVATDPDTGEEAFNPSFGRIVYSVSADGGKTWSAPAAVEDNDEGIFPGHQLMPATFGANGEVLLAWIDTRDDVVNGFRALGLDPAIDRQLIVDFWDAGIGLFRHSADIRAIRLSGGEVQGESAKISDYATGLIDLGLGPQLTQLEYNLVNGRLFQQGTAPFIGDYLNVTADAYNLDDAGGWADSNDAPEPGTPVFHVSHTDNRDLRGNAWGTADFSTATPYTPSGGEALASREQPSATDGGQYAVAEPPASPETAAFGIPDSPVAGQIACEASPEPQDRTRDQNVYSTTVFPRFSMQSPGSIKLSGPGAGADEPLRRAIPVVVRNHTDGVRYLQLHIDRQPAAGSASFAQDGAVEVAVPVKIWARSSAVRTVFVNTPDQLSSRAIPVSASLCDADGNCEATPVSRVLLNQTPLALEQPDYGDRSVLAQEVHNPDVLNRGLLNPDVIILLLQDPNLIEVLITAGLLPPGFSLSDLFNPAVVDAELLQLLQENPALLSPEYLDPELLALLLDNYRLLDRELYQLDPANPVLLIPVLLETGFLNPAFWDLLRTDDNLQLLIDGVANPNLLNDLALNPNLLNPDLLNLIVANPNLLNPDVLNALVANPNLLNFELANPNLLNPDLLNTLVSNPNLLNPGVFDGLTALAADPAYPAGGTERERLDYIEANYGAGFPELLSAVIANPNLLNPDLLNPNLLNLGVLNAVVANPTLLNPNLLNVSLLNPGAINPNLLNPNLLNPDLLNPDLLNLILLNPNLLNEVVANPNLLNPNLLNPNLLNPNLLNQVIDNPNLLNPNLLNPNLLNPAALNPNLLNAPLDAYSALENPQAIPAPPEATPGEDYFIDVTWQVRNTGNTTTGYMSQPIIIGATEEGLPEGVSASQLIVSKPYLRQTGSECQQVLQTANNVIVNVPNPRVIEPLQSPDPTDPETRDLVAALGSFWLSPGEIANVTLRVFGDPDVLGLDLVGLYVTSEACNSGVDSEQCKEDLPFVLLKPETGVEQALAIHYRWPRTEPMTFGDGRTVGIRWQYLEQETSQVVESGAILGDRAGGSIAPVTIERLSLNRSCDGSAAAPVTPGRGSALRYLDRNSTWVLKWSTRSDTVPEGETGPGCYRVSIPRADGVTDTVRVILTGDSVGVGR